MEENRGMGHHDKRVAGQDVSLCSSVKGTLLCSKKSNCSSNWVLCTDVRGGMLLIKAYQSQSCSNLE